ncbi:MAG: PEP-CTERM sorting domain-containing protein [Phycisphaerales bacterium]|nr:PEP-CTERM sorting domain-containing protein [Phycisphaerales bacterium]
MVGFRGWLAAGVVGVVACGGAVAATFAGLGFLPNGNASSAAAVSADGATIVGSAFDGQKTVAVRWVNGQIEPLGVIPTQPQASGAGSVSGDGSVIVGTSGVFPNMQGFRWEAGTLAPIGYLPGFSTGSAATSVSRDGSTVVGWSFNGANFRGLRLVGGSLQALPDLPGGIEDSAANAVSADGSIMAGRGISPGTTYEACIWVNGSAAMGLGDLPGGDSHSHVQGMNGDGSIHVGYANSASQSGGLWGEAARWVNGGPPESLGDLPGGAFNGYAFGVSDDGGVIVGFSTTALGVEAFVWDAENGMRLLRQVLEDDYGLDLTGWVLRVASAVTPDGRRIVGSGLNPDGLSEGWVVDLGCELAADVDGDGDVDFADLNALLGNFNSTGVGLAGDIDGDGDVDFADLNVLLGVFNTACE